MRTVRFLGNFVSLLVTAGIGAFIVAVGAGGGVFPGLSLLLGPTGGKIVTILIGASLLLTGTRFLIAIADERLNASLFVREGEWGRIEIAPFAIRECISGILRDEIGVERFRIRLYHRGDGVGIVVRITLSPDQRVTDVGEAIQRELIRHVAERTGVEVREVSVLVRSIRDGGKKEAADEPLAPS